jgi:hypothetical protein
MVTRLQVTLEQNEYTGLLKLASDEMRNPADQLRYMLKQALREKGRLADADEYQEPAAPGQRLRPRVAERSLEK